ncbi:hypothetical protein BDW72DRAFT_61896 [Aspergillus terricola var. indicus]
MSATLYPAETNGDEVTSFIPLTTAWPSSSGCASYFRLNGPSLMAFDPGYGLEINTDVRCCPPAVTTWWNQGLLGGGYEDHTAVSIGPMTCPEDWSTVVSSVRDHSSTLAMCCPPEYYLTDGTPGSVVGRCLSDVSSGMTITYASTPSDDSTAWTIVTTTLSRSSTVGAIGVVGWNMKIATTTSPTATSTTTSSTTTSTATSASSATPVATDESTVAAATTTTDSASGLSTGAKVGIGVGVGVGALGVVALLVALYLYTRRNKQPMSSQPDAKAQPMPQTNEQPVWPSELYAPARPNQWPARAPPAELVG